MLDEAIVHTAFAERFLHLIIDALRNIHLVDWILDSHITISTNFTTDCPDVLLQVYKKRLGVVMESLLIAAQRDRCCGSGEIGPARKVVHNIRFVFATFIQYLGPIISFDSNLFRALRGDNDVNEDMAQNAHVLVLACEVALPALVSGDRYYCGERNSLHVESF